MNRSHRSTIMRWLLLPVAVLAIGCTDQDLGTEPPLVGAGEAQLRIQIPLAATSVAQLTVEVTADDIEPLSFDLDIADGVASGSLTLPAGSARTITLRAFDAAGIETHRGSRTVDIQEGSNPEITITLDPLTGQQPIDAVMAEAVLVSVSPEDLIFLLGDTVQLTAQVVDAEGNDIDVPVRWAVVQPSLVEVSPEGRAWLTDATVESASATVVAALGTQYSSTAVTFMTPTAIVNHVAEGLVFAFNRWWRMTGDPDAGGPALSAMSFQHSSVPANFGMEYYPEIPRNSVVNDPAVAGLYTVHTRAFDHGYAAIIHVNEVNERLDHFVSRDMFDPATEPMVRALGAYLQGISYGALALRFDGGPLVGSHTELDNVTEATHYGELLDLALALLDEAIDAASTNTFDVPGWALATGDAFSSDVLVRAAHSYKARLRAGVARNPAERAAVDWQAVLADIESGIQEDFGYVMGSPYEHWSLYYTTAPSWSQMSYFVHGMADLSGRYQEWMSLPLGDRHPDLPNGPFLVHTPDTRFPQGESIGDQMESPGTRFQLPSNYTIGWFAPDRGSWRWSYYRTTMHQDQALNGFLPDLTVAEMDLLEAEARYRVGDPASAAGLVNRTRTAAGLNATDAAGTNTSCVPRLPDGSCGDLFEMIKWEKRLEASHTHAGYMMATWYYEGRGWGDLMEGSPLHWPIPAHHAERLGVPVRSYGGGLDFSAPVGTYGY